MKKRSKKNRKGRSGKRSAGEGRKEQPKTATRVVIGVMIASLFLLGGVSALVTGNNPSSGVAPPPVRPEPVDESEIDPETASLLRKKILEDIENSREPVKPKVTESPDSTPSPEEAVTELPDPPAEAPAPEAARQAEEIPGPSSKTLKVTVTKVIDGDTFRTKAGLKVRLIGINTAEKGETLADKATDLTRALTLGKSVTLEFDQTRKDQYGRTLAYVYSDGVMVNAEIIKRGLAYWYEWKPNTKHSQLFDGLQREARQSKAGLWGLPVSKPENKYLIVEGTHHFHRPGCKRSKHRSRKTISVATRDEAFDLGMNPCRACRP